MDQQQQPQPLPKSSNDFSYGLDDDSSGSNVNYKAQEASLFEKIKNLTGKKKSGEKLNEREVQELARLNRVKASRKYRMKEKNEKQ